MKKATIVILATLLAIAGYPVIASADVFSTTVPLSLTVPEAFGFILERYSHDFGQIQPGGGGETTIGIFCSSNHGRIWHMAINAGPFNSGVNAIPSDPNFTFAAWSDPQDPNGARGTFLFPTGAVMPDVQTGFYNSTIGEGSDPFTAMTLGLWIGVPEVQASGLYLTDMVITMHD